MGNAILEKSFPGSRAADHLNRGRRDTCDINCNFKKQLQKQRFSAVTALGARPEIAVLKIKFHWRKSAKSYSHLSITRS
jgi:hypothetical protein